MLPKKESLEIEFKSDRSRLSDNEIIEVVVSLANSNGGVLFLGIEDNGEVTGIHPAHSNLNGLAALIANHTVPSLSVHAELVGSNPSVIQIEVPKSHAIVSTTSGKALRRRLKADGTPETVAMYPYEFASRLSGISVVDYSAQIIPEAELSDLNPVERERLRNLIRENRGEEALLDLQDEEL